MPQNDLLKRCAGVSEVAWLLLGMLCPVIEREPERTGISVLAQGARQVNGASVDARWCARLEPFGCQAELLDLLCYFGSRGLSRSTRRDLRVEPEVNAPP